ncbi:hypothetical protein ACFQJC_03130 [Haloferax namakaokahaiae]|uniref:Uncharacterized protein n=1 Tax=Haloferax namakaokahaiae TaxID=1748331 RepID=A0ABD5ZB57_9EURY
MSLKDESSASVTDLAVAPSVVPISDVSPDTRVHHFDQLSDRTQQAIVDGSVSGHLDLDLETESTGLARGDVVVFTEYLLVR